MSETVPLERPRSPKALALSAVGCLGSLVLILLSASPDYFVTPVRLAVAGVGIGLFVVGGSALGKQLFGRNFDFSFWFSVTWLVLLGVAVAAAPWLPLGEHVDVANSLDQPLNAAPDPFSANPLGTNLFGLDLLARSVYGARSSLLIAMTAVVIGTVIGGAIGMVAGYFQKSVDRVIGIVTNSLLAVPPLILLIALATVLEPKIRNIAFALSLLTIPSMVRLARATTIVYAPREFVVAARALGATRGRILLRELLPNVLPPILSLAIVMISILIVAEASLSFLGLGIEPPEPTWGNMIAEGEGNVFEEYPHIVLVPGTFLFLTVFAFNLVGEKARRRWDPRSVKL
ncbi:ABC transporter permease [Alloactinosynnema sp. L-07]|uniref:ABC transporter permease n=1 Tax=Alloactinosynnema sp. L-07 TaxID=1653480 RepID=UPI0006B5EFDD|nr:ABC transporter permease [Alloactinosynnema sp. L-07]